MIYSFPKCTRLLKSFSHSLHSRPPLAVRFTLAYTLSHNFTAPGLHYFPGDFNKKSLIFFSWPLRVLLSKKIFTLVQKKVDTTDHFLVERTPAQLIGEFRRPYDPGTRDALFRDLRMFILMPTQPYCDITGCFKKGRQPQGMNDVRLSPWVWWMLPAWGELQVLWEQMYGAGLSWLHFSFTALWYRMRQCPCILSLPSMLWEAHCKGVCGTLGRRCELLSRNCWHYFNFIFNYKKRRITWQISTKGWRSRKR